MMMNEWVKQVNSVFSLVVLHNLKLTLHQCQNQLGFSQQKPLKWDTQIHLRINSRRKMIDSEWWTEMNEFWSDESTRAWSEERNGRKGRKRKHRSLSLPPPPTIWQYTILSNLPYSSSLQGDPSETYSESMIAMKDDEFSLQTRYIQGNNIHLQKLSDSVRWRQRYLRILDFDIGLPTFSYNFNDKIVPIFQNICHCEHFSYNLIISVIIPLFYNLAYTQIDDDTKLSIQLYSMDETIFLFYPNRM